MLWISTGGGVLYLHGSDELPLNSDKPADPLSAATTKLPLLTDGDSAQLSKVSDALGKATVEMFVHYVSHGATSWLPHPELVPEGLHGVEFGGVARESDDNWDPKAAGLAKYGGKNEGFSHYDTPEGNHMQVMKLAGHPQPLADGTPGIVWKVDGSSAVFVTLDGGRYVVDLSSADKGPTLEPGAGPQNGWPPPVQNTLLAVGIAGRRVAVRCNSSVTRRGPRTKPHDPTTQGLRQSFEGIGAWLRRRMRTAGPSIWRLELPVLTWCTDRFTR